MTGEEIMRPPIESETQFNVEIIRVESKSLPGKLKNYDNWREIFNEDLSKANLSEEQYSHSERIMETAIKDISMGERYGRDFSPILNYLAGLLQGKAILTRGYEMEAIKAAKTVRQEITRASSERLSTREEKAGRVGIKEKLTGNRNNDSQFGGE